MKYPFIRRAVAAALALFLVLTLSVSLTVPVWAAGENTAEPTLTITSAPQSPQVGDTVTLTAALTAGEAPSPVRFYWTCTEGANLYVALPTGTNEKTNTVYNTLTDTLQVTAIAAGTAKFTVTAKWGEDGTVTSNVFSLTIADKDSGESTPPSDNPGESTPPSDDPGESMTPEVSFRFASTADETHEPGSWTITTYLTNAPANAEITWEVVRATGQEGTKLPTFTGTTAANQSVTGTKVTVTDTAIRLTSHGAGNFIVTATYGGTMLTKRVTVSGIVLSGPKVEIDAETGVYSDSIEMFAGGSTSLTVTLYGLADDRNATKVEWISGDSSVVSVPNNGGNLYAWGLGSTVITATKGKYSADCTVTVVEDTSVIATGFFATASEPLILNEVYAKLNDICLQKTADYGEYSNAAQRIGYGLNYVTNLRVSPNQGTLYYNYSTESDTGEGVGYTDQFALTVSGTTLSLSRLYFVPAQGFDGTAEISFSAIAANGRNIAGTIRVEVGSGSSGGTYQISYAARAGEPVWFLADDFDSFCRSNTGRSYSYVVFTLPRSSEGTLYYNYVAGSGNPVTTTIQFGPSGRYALDDVCFVPSATFSGWVSINFRAVDTSGETVSGTVMVNVTASSDYYASSSVRVSGERGQPVALQGELFNVACKSTIYDSLSFVTFKLPDPDVGALYVNYRSEEDYDSRVTAATRCYYSGVPGLNSVSFVPTSSASGRIAISYTGYGSGGTSFAGTLYIDLGETDRTTIYYFVTKDGSVTFNAADFYNAALYQTGVALNYVRFTDENYSYYSFDFGSLGSLRYNYRSSTILGSLVNSYTNYYYNPSYSWYQRLSLISFHAGNEVGTITIPYVAICGTGSDQQTFSGTVVIQVGTLAPDDVSISCRTGGQAWLSSAVLSSVCDTTMSGSLSYIEVTSVPTSDEGHLYLNYSGFGTGTAVKPGDRFYRVGSPNIDQLSFVPFARFTGEVEITYIGYSLNGSEQVSGRILVNVSNSTASQYFNDMGGYTWAVDSVDYLRRNGTVLGVGDNRFDPEGTIIKGDFTLMLVRAYSLTASGSASFHDVPSDSYYADAIRIAALLGVAGGTNGNYSPETALTRQDAMVMIYNSLKASGKNPTNGLAADLSAFYDEGQIASYAREAMGSLVQMGVVKGDGDGYLRPQDLLNRAEAAMLLHTIMSL